MKNITLTLILLTLALAGPQAEAKSKAKKAKAKSSSHSKKAPQSAPTPTYNAPSSYAPAQSSQPENADVGAIKQRYWTQGDDSEIGVVQNRIYSKSGRLELGTFGGVLFTDPFLNVGSLGGSIGYHFSEFLGLHALGWKSFASPSSAYTKFEETRGAIPLVNEPKWFAGGQLTGSLLYGKLSLLGKSIIYYDFHILGGLGMTGTDSGQYLTPFVGLGQQVYLSQNVAIGIDYRLMVYKEDLIETVNPATIGTVVSTRTNFTNAITLGLTFLIGGSSNSPGAGGGS